MSNSFTEDSWTPGGGDDGGTKMFCICHSSRFDPTALEMNTNRNRSNGATFNYAGIREQAVSCGFAHHPDSTQRRRHRRLA